MGNTRSASMVDMQVARNIRALREKSDLSQEKVGKMLGLSFQQVQKYENGKNRVSAGRLAQLASIYEVSISDLFEGVQEDL